MHTRASRLGALAIAMSLGASCAGRPANPVTVHQYGDEQKSCTAIERELAFIQDEIHRLMPETEKTGKNVALGVAGVFLLFPWFFMDLSKAEQIEVDALRHRYNHLLILANEKACPTERQAIPDFRAPQPESPDQTVP